jgi:hypothetical protein
MSSVPQGDIESEIFLKSSWIVGSWIAIADFPWVKCDVITPPSPLIKATLYTQVIKSNSISDKLPPSPQFRGNRTLQNPPELGDFGDAQGLKRSQTRLMCIRQPDQGGDSVKLQQLSAGG